MKKLGILFVSILIISCASRPYIRQFRLADDTNMYFFPASTWSGGDVIAKADFNFKSNADIEIICNISITQKASMPKGISSLVFISDLREYPLSDVQILLVDSKTNTVRITSLLGHDDFLAMMKSNEVVLQITMDEMKYECIPDADFSILKTEFQNTYFAMENILK
ncbi:MAG: hypothetical protein LBT39_02720 [Treponema sp.]|jgi:hypothetical protein|nr:hypothetical protein [Treponema sp.]